MTVFLSWLAQLAPLLYLFCLGGMIGYTVIALRADQRNRSAQFLLERENARHQATRAWVVAGLFLGLGVITFLASSYLLPLLPLLEPLTPETGVGILTPTPTTTPVPTAELTPTPTPFPTALPPAGGASAEAPTATPTPTATPPPPEVYQPDCPSPNAQVIAPVAGGTLDGVVEIRGTATVNAFSFYKFEVEFPDSDFPVLVGQYNTAVESGLLGMWDVSDRSVYPAGGPYRFRLMVVDIYGNTTLCIIPVNLGQAPGGTSP